MSTVRHSGFDNLKGILIICVVLGHFLELCPSNSPAEDLYLMIYSFHMPLFFFISGFYAKFSSRRLLRLFVLYGVFQLLYSIFALIFLKSAAALTPSRLLFNPYWLLWYLLVSIYNQLLLPAWLRLGRRGKWAAFLLSIPVSLLCGYCPQIGYPLSLSRFLVFLPYFLAGSLLSTSSQRITLPKPILSAVLAVMLSVYLCRSGSFTARMLYGSYPYSIGYHPGIRLQLMVIAAVWILFFLSLSVTMLKRRLPVLSYIGAHTLPIYLLHGFTVKLAGLLMPSLTVTEACLLSFLTVALLGNPFTVRFFDWAQQPLRKK